MSYDDYLKDEMDRWIVAMKAQGHLPRMDSVGLDIFVFDTGHHNGPGCETCGASWCMHCDGPEEIEPCTSPVIENTLALEHER